MKIEINKNTDKFCQNFENSEENKNILKEQVNDFIDNAFNYTDDYKNVKIEINAIPNDNFDRGYFCFTFFGAQNRDYAYKISKKQIIEDIHNI